MSMTIKCTKPGCYSTLVFGTPDFPKQQGWSLIDGVPGQWLCAEHSFEREREEHPALAAMLDTLEQRVLRLEELCRRTENPHYD